MACNCNNNSIGNCGCSEPIELECLDSPGATGASGTNGTNGTDGIVILKNDFTEIDNGATLNAYFPLTSLAYTILGSATGYFKQDGDKMIMRYLFDTGVAGESLNHFARIMFDVSTIYEIPIILKYDGNCWIIIELQVSRYSSTELRIIVKNWITRKMPTYEDGTYSVYERMLVRYTSFTKLLTENITVTAEIKSGTASAIRHKNTCIEFYNKI